MGQLQKNQQVLLDSCGFHGFINNRNCHQGNRALVSFVWITQKSFIPRRYSQSVRKMSQLTIKKLNSQGATSSLVHDALVTLNITQNPNCLFTQYLNYYYFSYNSRQLRCCCWSLKSVIHRDNIILSCCRLIW